MDLSIEYLKQNYTYSDGFLFKNSKRIGYFDKSSGYYRCKIKNKTYLLHRLIFWMFNEYLTKDIDHIDRNKLNNKIENLRPVEHRGQNTVNTEKRSDNTSGYKGVTWHKNAKKWHSSVFHKGKRHYVGIYDDINEAAKAYDTKATELFEEFAKLNIK